MHFDFPIAYSQVQRKHVLIPAGFITAYLLTGCWLLHDYVITDANFFIGILLLPYLIIPQQQRRLNFTYFLLAFTCLITSLWIPFRILYYLTIGFSILFVLESFIGKLNYLSFCLLLVLSPLFKYLTVVFGFPIRLELSALAGKIISTAGYEAKVAGDIILVNGYEFSVDAACVGLQMLITSFIIGLFMLAYYQRKTSKNLSLIVTMLVMAAVLVLNIGCNLMRIVVLVLFKLMPDSPLHYLAGIICLVVYVFIPLNYLIRWLFSYSTTAALPKRPLPEVFTLGCNGLLCLSVLLLGLHTQFTEKPPSSNASNYHIDNYSKQVLASGVIKFEKPEALVYIKPVANQFGIEHSPMVCWQGSGYTFKNINKAIVEDLEIYTGILTKDKDLIYTAWWFDNGKYRTIHPLAWRWQALRGEPGFSLINVNAPDEQVLLEEITSLLLQPVFLNETKAPVPVTILPQQ